MYSSRVIIYTEGFIMLYLVYLRIFRSVYKIAKNEYWLRHVCLSVWLSTWNNSAPTGRIITKFDVWIFFENLSEKFKFL